tara:strand:- start:455 stop:931 length:477 start_codon:yes stop_codon:yes gene_type:complete
MPKGVYIRTEPSSRRGVNKYGIKLEDFDSYENYKKAIKFATEKAYRKTPKGKLTNEKYCQTDKYKLFRRKYRQGIGKVIFNALNAKRRSTKLQRTVGWTDHKAIKEFYANCPKGYHVDHIVPLQGTNVSGLHVLNNLQYLTATQNLKKGNKYGHQQIT